MRECHTSHAFDENGAIARTLEAVLRDFLIGGTVVPRARLRCGRKLHDYDTFGSIALEYLLRPVGGQNLDRMTLEGRANLALVNIEFVLVLRAFPREDDISRHGVRSCRAVKVR